MNVNTLIQQLQALVEQDAANGELAVYSASESLASAHWKPEGLSEGYIQHIGDDDFISLCCDQASNAILIW